MDDYINRDSVIELSREYYSQGLKEKAVPVTAIRNIPSADVAEVRHGKWVDGDVDGIGACGIEYRYKKCSICGYEYSFPIKYSFCPNCGARMDGE